jgi:hypothetical protein
MYSQLGNRPPFATNPPLPHQPQSHYYNLPDLNLGLDVESNPDISPGESGYYCGLDTLSRAGDESAKAAENVLLVGYHRGIDIFRVERRRMDIVGRLEGLRGGVLEAKILPWTSRTDPFAEDRPLIALVLHGPVIDAKSSNNGSGSSSVVDDSSSAPPSRPASSRGDDAASQVTHYQTTVEVYSLRGKRRVAVLYKSPLIAITHPVDSPMFEPPAPVGALVIDAKGKFVVVASGTSGEVFIFAPYLRGHADHCERFRCLGKLWTSVIFRERGSPSSASSAADGSHEEVTPEEYGTPIFSLSDRWLAITPPASTTLYPVGGAALTSPYYEKPPGLAHHTVPTQPSPNCAVDAPETAGFIDRLTREGTQVAIKGARWATEKGIQAFKNYMNRGTQGTANMAGPPYGSDPMQQQYFPPTHGHNQAQQRQEATVISIYDLDRLLDAEDIKPKHALNPLVTIPASLGCSFLSFSPSGLLLMTVSTKGDFQDAWDLKRINFRRARKTSREKPTGPHVRQVARFARMTVTNVVDVVWSSPRPDRLAVVTDKGTVHMFLMPASTFQWPPPRRSHKPGSPTKSQDDDVTSNERVGAISSAMQALNGTAKPFINAVRARNSGNGSRFPSLSNLGMTPAAGAKSGKAVAAGVGKSISNIRHAGDNKLALPQTRCGVKPGSVRWLTGGGRGSIALVAGGVLQLHRVYMRPATSRGKSGNATTITKKKLVEFGLAPIHNSTFAPSAAAQLCRQAGDPETPSEFHGEWLPRSLPGRRLNSRAGGKIHYMSAPTPLSLSEIETNPPYQPFYTDRRVTRFLFISQPAEFHDGDSGTLPSDPVPVSNLHHDNDDTPWLFGEDYSALRISSPARQSYDSDDGITDVAARIENKLSLKDGRESIEQVVVTTRRRRVQHGVGDDDDGFFEDDCDVLDFAEDRV